MLDANQVGKEDEKWEKEERGTSEKDEVSNNIATIYEEAERSKRSDESVRKGKGEVGERNWSDRVRQKRVSWKYLFEKCSQGKEICFPLRKSGWYLFSSNSFFYWFVLIFKNTKFPFLIIWIKIITFNSSLRKPNTTLPFLPMISPLFSTLPTFWLNSLLSTHKKFMSLLLIFFNFSKSIEQKPSNDVKCSITI